MAQVGGILEFDSCKAVGPKNHGIHCTALQHSCKNSCLNGSPSTVWAHPWIAFFCESLSLGSWNQANPAQAVCGTVVLSPYLLVTGLPAGAPAKMEGVSLTFRNFWPHILLPLSRSQHQRNSQAWSMNWSRWNKRGLVCIGLIKKMLLWQRSVKTIRDHSRAFKYSTVLYPQHRLFSSLVAVRHLKETLHHQSATWNYQSSAQGRPAKSIPIPHFRWRSMILIGDLHSQAAYLCLFDHRCMCLFHHVCWCVLLPWVAYTEQNTQGKAFTSASFQGQTSKSSSTPYFLGVHVGLLKWLHVLSEPSLQQGARWPKTFDIPGRIQVAPGDRIVDVRHVCKLQSIGQGSHLFHLLRLGVVRSTHLLTELKQFAGDITHSCLSTAKDVRDSMEFDKVVRLGQEFESSKCIQMLPAQVHYYTLPCSSCSLNTTYNMALKCSETLGYGHG